MVFRTLGPRPERGSGHQLWLRRRGSALRRLRRIWWRGWAVRFAQLNRWLGLAAPDPGRGATRRAGVGNRKPSLYQVSLASARPGAVRRSLSGPSSVRIPFRSRQREQASGGSFVESCAVLGASALARFASVPHRLASQEAAPSGSRPPSPQSLASSVAQPLRGGGQPASPPARVAPTPRWVVLFCRLRRSVGKAVPALRAVTVPEPEPLGWRVFEGCASRSCSVGSGRLMCL